MPKYCCAAHRQAAHRSRHGSRVQWECQSDDVAHVVALATLTEDRSDEEQEALLRLAQAVDRRRGNDNALETRQFITVPTGAEVYLDGLTYVGTAFLDDWVFHVYAKASTRMAAPMHGKP
jgi:hypothetical protein